MLRVDWTSGGTLRRLLPLFAWCVAQSLTAQAPEPAFRHRLLGVYDLGTGAVVEGVEVTDVSSGTTAITTRTGTVTLAFLPEGRSLLRIRRFAYQAVLMTVAISPADTLPVTVL